MLHLCCPLVGQVLHLFELCILVLSCGWRWGGSGSGGCVERADIALAELHSQQQAHETKQAHHNHHSFLRLHLGKHTGKGIPGLHPTESTQGKGFVAFTSRKAPRERGLRTCNSSLTGCLVDLFYCVALGTLQFTGSNRWYVLPRHGICPQNMMASRCPNKWLILSSKGNRTTKFSIWHTSVVLRSSLQCSHFQRSSLLWQIFSCF